jgi:hypothetical protein
MNDPPFQYFPKGSYVYQNIVFPSLNVMETVIDIRNITAVTRVRKTYYVMDQLTAIR